MPPALKSLLALAGAVGMVGGAVVVRSALDEKKVNDAIEVRLTCDPATVDACRQAAAVDPRIKVTEEPAATTRDRLRGISAGEDPGLDAWVTVGPWMAISDGARQGQAPLGRRTEALASTPVVLVGRADLAVCKPSPSTCTADQRKVGIADPTRDGVGLAGATAVVTGASGVPVTDLDRSALTTGPAADALRKLRTAAVSAGLEVVNTNFSTAGVLVTTAATASVVRGRPGVGIVQLPVHAVAEASFLTDDAAIPLGADTPAGDALRQALVKGGWEAKPQASNLPDAGVLAALQDAWAQS